VRGSLPGEQAGTEPCRIARTPGSHRGEASHRRSSGSEPDTALGPAAGDDRAAGPRAHPDPEAMGLGAFTVVRLKCTLHDDGS
jgi:hypothetical protein